MSRPRDDAELDRAGPGIFEIWVCADDRRCDHTKNLVPVELSDRHRELGRGMLEVDDDAVRFCVPGAEDNFVITGDGAEKPSGLPDGIVVA